MFRICVLVLIGSMAFGGETVHVSIPSTEFKAKMAQEKGELIDVRTPKEYAEGRLVGAKLINYYDEQFKTKMGELNKEKTYYIYCRSGGRSGKTLKMMKEMGFKRVYDMSDGFMGWSGKNLPIEK